MRRLALWLAAVILALAAAMPVLADGVVIPDHPMGWLTIVYHRVRVTLHDGVAKTHVDQAFRNDTPAPVEGTYVFPLSPGAVMEGFTLWVNGKPVAGAVLPADQAREIYLSYLRQSRDPALLEYVGRDAFRARVFPIAPGETRRIELEYTELLIPDAELFRYAYPLAIERFSARPIEEVRIEVDLAASYPLGSVYSPSHPLTVARTSPSAALGVYLERNVLPKKDFVLYYAFSETLVGADLIAYKVGEEDGWFLLLISPPPLTDAPALPKDLVLVVDRSGSMEGVKMDQAKDAAQFIIEHLGPEDRFGVITFNEAVAALTEGLNLATSDRVAAAVQAVGTVSADGWTNIHDALRMAMSWFSPNGRPQYVIFLTDGLPTRGPTDTATIVREVTAANATGARLFAFGVGYDVDAHLLDLLAQENRGTTTYVKPDENLERALSAFYRKIAEPALTDLVLTVDGATAWDHYPRQLPDLFHGGQITLVGRYTGSGSATITLRASRGGTVETFVYPRDFPAHATEADFLPRLWASRKIGYLLDRIRLEGESDEIVDQIVELALRYGIATPYTSFLVAEDERAHFPPPDAFRMMSGAPAVGAAQAAKSMAEAEVVKAPERVRDVGGRVFILRDTTWTESTYPEDAPVVKVQYLSEAYWKLLEVLSDVGPILALGEEVIFRAGTVFVHVGAEGLTELAPEILAQLSG